MQMEYKKLDFTAANENIEEDACQILKVICPHWNKEEILIKRLSDGFVNQNYRCHLVSDVNLTNALVIRVNGTVSLEYGADREREIRTLRLLNRKHCGVPLFASFNNGIVMGNIKGETINDEQMRDPHISGLIATEFARLHSATPTDVEKTHEAFAEFQDPLIMVKMTHKNLPTSYKEPLQNKRYKENIPYEEISGEFHRLVDHLSQVNLVKALCHNDLWSGNILYDKITDRIDFIDWEECGYTFAAFDIAVHFVWLAGVPAKEEYKPSNEFKKHFIKLYLEEISLLRASTNGQRKQHIGENEIHNFYVQTCKCELLALLFIAMMLIEMNVDETVNDAFITYDYLGHAEYCWKEYQTLKEEYYMLS